MTHNPAHLQKKPNTDERYTPKWVFDRLGLQFVLDVAAPVDGPRHTPCLAWHDINSDGLAHDWHGLVWMNPPYSKPKPWIAKFRDHANGVALLPTSQGQWWLDLWYDERTYFVPMPSIKFETESGEMLNTAPWRSWLVGMGEAALEALHRWEN